MQKTRSPEQKLHELCITVGGILTAFTQPLGESPQREKLQQLCHKMEDPTSTKEDMAEVLAIVAVAAIEEIVELVAKRGRMHIFHALEQ